MTGDLSKKKVKSSGDKRAKRKVKRRETYAMYIYKVLKQVSVDGRQRLSAAPVSPVYVFVCFIF